MQQAINRYTVKLFTANGFQCIYAKRISIHYRKLFSIILKCLPNTFLQQFLLLYYKSPTYSIDSRKSTCYLNHCGMHIVIKVFQASVLCLFSTVCCIQNISVLKIVDNSVLLFSYCASFFRIFSTNESMLQTLVIKLNESRKSTKVSLDRGIQYRALLYVILFPQSRALLLYVCQVIKKRVILILTRLIYRSNQYGMLLIRCKKHPMVAECEYMWAKNCC